MFDRVTVLGAGLLGASILQALHERKACKGTAVWSRSADTRNACRNSKWAGSVSETPSDAVADADLVILCTPVDHIPQLCTDIASALKPAALVTDVGSVKEAICNSCSLALPDSAHFIGSHPMAGSDKSGLSHASSNLFENRSCIITPLPGTNNARIEQLSSFWSSLGMKVSCLSPTKHDALVARISHLPHLLSSTLCSQLTPIPEDELNLAGAGLRDTTRIAAGDPSLWEAIFSQNRSQLLEALEEFEKSLGEIKSALNDGDTNAVIQFLQTAKDLRLSLNNNSE